MMMDWQFECNHGQSPNSDMLQTRLTCTSKVAKSLNSKCNAKIVESSKGWSHSFVYPIYSKNIPCTILIRSSFINKVVHLFRICFFIFLQGHVQQCHKSAGSKPRNPSCSCRLPAASVRGFRSTEKPCGSGHRGHHWRSTWRTWRTGRGVQPIWVIGIPPKWSIEKLRSPDFADFGWKIWKVWKKI